MEGASFEDSMERLAKIVSDIEGGSLSLSEMMAQFKEGLKLADSCTKQLQDAELTVKRLVWREGQVILQPENPDFKKIVLQDGQELQVWGVVTSTTKKFI